MVTRAIKTTLLVLAFTSTVAFAQLGMLQHRRAAFRATDLVLWLVSDDNVSATGTWIDKSGNGNHCVLVNDAYVTASTGLILDGNGDYGLVSQSAELEFGTGDFTLSFWILTSVTSNGVAMHYGDRADSAGITVYGVVGSTSKSQCNLTDGTNTANTASTTDTNDNAWHHVVFSCDRGGNNSVYVDGGAADNAVDITSVGSLNTDDHDEWVIGAFWSGTVYANALTGTLDDIRIYSIALTQVQVQAIYDAGAHKP